VTQFTRCVRAFAVALISVVALLSRSPPRIRRRAHTSPTSSTSRGRLSNGTILGVFVGFASGHPEHLARGCRGARTDPGHVRDLPPGRVGVLPAHPRHRTPTALPPRNRLQLRAQYLHAGPLLGQPIKTPLIADHWADLLRLVASMKFGHTTASLLIAKLHASSRQSTLAKALHEYGRLIRSIYVPLRRRRGVAPP
jgi:Tn3 transposase DDE domain